MLWACLGIACGGAEPEPDGVNADFEIVSFSAEHSTVHAGDSVALVWQTRGAEHVRVEATPGGLLAEGAQQAGAIASGPLSEHTLFRLVARRGAAMLEQTLRVTVEGEQPGEGGPEITRFEADPQTVQQGSPVRLSWTVRDATQVTLEGPRAEILYDGADLTSAVSTTPEQSGIYTLRARGRDGDAEATVHVTVERQPGAVAILSFAATPESIALSETLTLAWSTVNATEVQIVDASGRTLVMSPDAAGSLEVTPGRSQTYTLRATDDTQVVERTVSVTVSSATPPTIPEFQAIPSVITAGDNVRLRWTVVGATDVRISAQGRTVYRGQMLQGEASDTPEADTIYTLTATGQGLETAATVSVRVGAAIEPQILSFDTSLEDLILGRSAILSWRVQDAAGGVEITEQDASGATVIHSALDPVGSISVTPNQDTEYVLLARGTGQATAQATVLIRVTAAGPPQIVSFNATPNPVRPLGATELSWDVRAATGIRLLRVRPDPTVLFDGPAGTGLGAFQTNVGDETTVYNLEAEGPNGRTTGSISVAVSPPPMIEATIPVVAAMEAVVSWNVQYADTVEIYANGILAASAQRPFPNNEATIAITEDTVVIVRATNPVGSTEVNGFIYFAAQAGANLAPTSAISFSSTVGAAVGSLNAVQAHWFAIEVPDGGTVLSYPLEPGTAYCTPSVEIDLIAPDGSTVLVEPDWPPHGGNCYSVHGYYHGPAFDMAAGRYYLRVRSPVPADYDLLAQVIIPRCGNGLAETRVQETCDDGNATNGDGCDISCQAEILQSLRLNPTPVELTGRLAEWNDAAYYAIEIETPSYLSADLYSPAAPGCPEALGLALWTDAGALLGTVAGWSVDPWSCSTLIDRDPLDAGHYLLSVLGAEHAVTLDYELHLKAEPYACGDGYIDPGEACDDGNQTNGDGCSSSCEVDGLHEVEPNDDQATATPLTNIDNIYRGALTEDLAGVDEDYYLLEVQNDGVLESWVATDGVSGCNFADNVDLVVIDENGLILAESQPFFDCAQIGPLSLTAGRYYIKLSAFREVPEYVLHVSMTVPGP